MVYYRGVKVDYVSFSLVINAFPCPVWAFMSGGVDERWIVSAILLQGLHVRPAARGFHSRTAEIGKDYLKPLFHFYFTFS